MSYEAMRALGYASVGGADVMEVLMALDQIDATNPIESWYSAFNTLALRVEAEARRSEQRKHWVSARQMYFKACMYHRSAAFFLTILPKDPREMQAYDASVNCFRKAIQWTELKVEAVSIPYEGTTMDGYLARGRGGGKQPLAIMHTGFDGTAEEVYFVAIGLIERGYTCLIFDGPGQGGTLRKRGLVFRPDWEVPVRAVIDFAKKLSDVDLSKLALLGYSFGGYLAPRAAAFLSDIKVCAANPGVMSMFTVVMNNFPPIMATLLESKPEEFTKYYQEGAKSNLGAQWSLGNGLFTFGKKTAADWVTTLKQYSLEGGIAEKITATTLVIDSSDDTMMTGVAKPLYDHLKCPKTWMYFNGENGAQLHDQVGAQIYANQQVLDWLDEAVKG